MDSLQELQKMTLVVVVFSVIFALIIWLADTILSKFLKFILICCSMSEVKDKKWYVVRAISGQENKIKTFIDNEVKRLNLSNFVEEVIVPTQKGVQIRNGKK